MWCIFFQPLNLANCRSVIIIIWLKIKESFLWDKLKIWWPRKVDFKTTWSLQKMVEEKLFFEGTSENKYSGDGWSLQLRGLGYVAANHNIRSLDPSSATTSSKGKDYFWNYNPLSHNFKKSYLKIPNKQIHWI